MHKSTSYRLEEETLDRIDILARDKKISRQSVIELAVETLWSQHQGGDLRRKVETIDERLRRLEEEREGAE